MSKLIIFDIDGTLTDTKKVDDKCFIDAFEQTFGISIINQQWEDLTNVTDWGITEEIIKREFDRNPKAADYDKMIESFVDQLEKERTKDKNQFKEVTGARKFYEHIRSETDWQIGIATGSWGKSAKIKLRSIGIDPMQVAFSNCDYYKSREDITRHTIRQAEGRDNQKFSEIIYFGDGVWDFKTCQNLGIHFIGIDILNDQKLIKMGSKTVFENFENRDLILNEIRSIK